MPPPPPLSAQVKRKILVLDLDETLIHSHHDGVLRPTVRPGTPPDFILKVKGEGGGLKISGGVPVGLYGGLGGGFVGAYGAGWGIG